MRDFADTLNDRLMAMADELAAQTPEAAAKQRRPKRRRSAFAGGLTASAAAVAAFFALSGTSLADLPILRTATTDASDIRHAVPGVAQRGVDFSKAHVFGTPGGPGYVFTTPGQSTVCIVVPDEQAPGTYGSSCGTPLQKVEDDGLAAENVGDRSTDPNATTLFAFVLPDRAKDARITIGGQTTPAHVESGVVVGTTNVDARLTWTVDGRLGTRTFAGPFHDTGVVCPDGSKSIPMSKVPTVRRGNGPPTIDMHAFAKACK